MILPVESEIKETILVVDDEADIVELVCFNLEQAGFQTLKALDGSTGLELAKQHRPNAIVLDLMLPGMNGFEVFKALKFDTRTKNIPVLMVTARAETTDRITGLKAGADDYITKPFSPKELVLRVQAVLKWAPPKRPDTIIESGPLFLDRSDLSGFLNGAPLRTTSTEFKLLTLLVDHMGEVVTRQALFDKIWGKKEDCTSRTLDTHMMRLKEKLGDEARYIKNVRGKGYCYAPPAERN